MQSNPFSIEAVIIHLLFYSPIDNHELTNSPSVIVANLILLYQVVWSNKYASRLLQVRHQRILRNTLMVFRLRRQQPRAFQPGVS